MDQSNQGIETFSSENLTVKVTKKPHCQIKFDVTVQPKGIEAAHQMALKNVKKEVLIPGFRKGKAPDKLLSEKYGSAIQKEWVQVALNTAMNEAVHLSHIAPIKEGAIKPSVLECSLEKGGHFTFEFESRPHIPEIDLKEIKIKKIPPAVITDLDEENAVRNVALQFTTYEPIEGRPIEVHDFIDINVDIIKEDGTINPIIENQRTQIAEHGLPIWIRNKIIGLNAGDSVEGITEADPKHPNPDFQATPFKATVLRIWKGEMPPMDDELAKKVGLNSFEELKTFIRDKLTEQAQEEASRKELAEIEEAFLEKYPIEVPQSFIEDQKKDRLKNYSKMLEEKNQLDYFKSHKKQIEESIEKNTIRYFQLMFLFRKIAKDHDLKVTQEEIQKEFNHQLTLMSSGKNNVDFNDKENFRDQLYSVTLNRKIEEFLLDNVTSLEG